MKSLLFAISLCVALAGCSQAVKHTVSDEFARTVPVRVVVAPVVWEGSANEDTDRISLLFRQMSVDALRRLNYQSVPLGEVDAAAQGGSAWFAGRATHEITAPFGADSVLYIRMKDWDADRLSPYAALSITASYELRSASGGTLWKAEYTTSEADFNLDNEPMRLAMYKAYEPRIQRFVDAVFSTLPLGQAREESRKSYFKWLP